MRKINRLITGYITRASNRAIIQPLDDGIMVIPIPDEQRDAANVSMKAFIKRDKEEEESKDK